MHTNQRNGGQRFRPLLTGKAIMNKTTMAKVTRQERKLDEAQAILRQVIKQIHDDLAAYRMTDLRKLEAAYRALDVVTLRKDLD